MIAVIKLKVKETPVGKEEYQRVTFDKYFM
jgi:hypothetical protein